MKNKKKIKILVTLGPSSLTEDFLKFSLSSKISLLRLNMSHIDLNKLEETIQFIRKYNDKTPICIDTEGAQIRTKTSEKKLLKLGEKFEIYKSKRKISLYPEEVFNKLKINDNLLIGFDNLQAKIIKKNTEKILLKTTSEGFLEGNKGVHIKNRNIGLNYLTNKDLKSIYIGKKNKINNFALSFTNSENDIKRFKKILKKENKIYKIETLSAIRKLEKIVKEGDKFLIDRGDLSKETEIEKIPKYQRKIINLIKKFKKKEIFIATNLLESMTQNINPTRAEANDIFNCLEMGASGLVLAAETAIGKYPKESVIFLMKMIKEFSKEIHE
tara:strand:+ start:18853 stop:19836 length:984 start_codon:yes stop_codon:yes gene_type:complete